MIDKVPFIMFVVHVFYLFIVMHLYFARHHIEIFGCDMSGRKMVIPKGKMTVVECFWLVAYVIIHVTLIIICAAEWLFGL